MSYKKCRKHTDCRKVKTYGYVLELIKCPYCGNEISASSSFTWCANCYCSFIIEKGYAHFSRNFEKTTAQKWAVAFAKCGGLSFGGVKENNNQ